VGPLSESRRHPGVFPRLRLLRQAGKALRDARRALGVAGRPAPPSGAPDRAFNNEWTVQLGGELRFYFEHDVAKGRYIVRDRQKPGEAQWQLDTSAENRQIAADYALATRVFNANTEQYVVVAAGVTEIGTMAASEFLTTPEYFAHALAGAPSDWRRKNIQVVLSAKVMSGTAGPPHVLAVHYW
jgi:hypothetical protein